MGGFTTWPDGKPLLDQPVKLIGAFRAIGRHIETYRPKSQG